MTFRLDWLRHMYVSVVLKDSDVWFAMYLCHIAFVYLTLP